MPHHHELHQDLPQGTQSIISQEFAQNIHVQGLNPGKAIAEIKKLLAGIADKGEPGLKVKTKKIILDF